MERRLKIFHISTDILESFFNWRNEDSILLPVFEGIPEDAHINHVYYDALRMSFAAVIFSNDFDVVPDGYPVPSVDGVIRHTLIELEYKD